MRERLVFTWFDYTADPMTDGRWMVDLDTLPLTQATREALRAWAGHIDALNYEAIDEGRGLADDDLAAIAAEQERLWLLVREELAATHEIGLRQDDGSVRWEP